jgi:superfamily II DNA or RNA helicase
MLRDYQRDLVDAAREKLYRENKRSVVIQLPTGGGKTPIVAEIFSSVFSRKKCAWFVVPRNELIRQASEHLQRWHVPHGIIGNSRKESRVFIVHVVSKDTILRRLDKIKRIPDLVIFDEAHIAFDGVKKIMASLVCLNENIKFIGVTATPEREDGRGLSELYEDIVYGPGIPYLTQCNFLSPLKYYAPPVEGIELLKFKGSELDENELDKIMTERAVYGKAVDYYSRYGKKPDGAWRRALGFCLGTKAAEKQAAEFRKAGFRAEAISGYLPKARQRALIDALNSGTVQILVNADLLTYGFDSPKVEYGFSLRRTKSRALYFQIVGRLLRVAPGKTEALFFDHADAIRLHQDPRYPGVPLFSVPDLSWDFEGQMKKRKRKAAPPAEVRRCPYQAFEICTQSIRCPQCERYKPQEKDGPVVVESIPLQERRALQNAHIITAAEKREAQDDVIRYAEMARTAADDDSYDRAVAALVNIAEQLGRSVMWAYHYVNKNKYVVNVRLINSIGKAKGYKEGWAFYRIQELRDGMKEKAG